MSAEDVDLVYLCHSCDSTHRTTESAATCCEPEEVWLCSCGERWNDQDEAETCCPGPGEV